MRKLAFALLVVGACGLGGAQGPAPASSRPPLYEPGPRTGLPFYRPELWGQGKAPYVDVFREDRFREAQKPRPAGEAPPAYEWQVPLSSLEGTRSTARRLRRAWQRLEERTYWRAMADLNQPVSTLGCAAGLWDALHGELAPEAPQPAVSAIPDYFPRRLAGSLPLDARPAAADAQLRLDAYGYYYFGLPDVPGRDFCDDLPLELVPVLIPGSCLRTPLGDVCTPGYPDPLWVDEGAAHHRVTRALEHAARRYVREYEKEVLEAVAPRLDLKGLAQGQDPDYFNPTGWSGPLLGAGALVTPVARFAGPAAEDLKAVAGVLQRARYGDERLRAAVWPYYGQALAAAARLGGVALERLGVAAGVLEAGRAGLPLLQGEGYRDADYPGVWPLEELKRYFPVSSPQVQEALGYASYFQVFGRFDLTSLPDPKARWGGGEFAAVAALRSVHLWNVPVLCEPVAGPPWVVCYPDVRNSRPWPVPPYTLVYAGPRYYWDWVSVPEGYPIPRVRGLPKALPVSR